MTVQTYVGMGEALAAGLEAIGLLSKNRGDQADQALEAIGAVWNTLQSGFSGDLAPSAITDALKTLTTDIAQNDADAHAALLEKFKQAVTP